MIEYIIGSWLLYLLFAWYGVTKGLHAYWSHKQFKAGPFYEWTSLIAALFVGAYKPIGWVGVHRLHHRYTDTEKDPHIISFWAKWTGIYLPKSVVRDVIRNPRMRFFEKNGKYLIMIPFILFPLLPIIGYVSMSSFNYFAHGDGKSKPRNAWWLNLLCPGEGKHLDHHNYGK